MGSKRAKTKVNKINKHEVHAQKQKRNLFIMSGFLIVVMFLGTFSVMLYDNDDESSNDSQNINGFSFNLDQNEYFEFWNVTKTPRDKKDFRGVSYMYLPEDTTDYAFTGDMNTTLDLISSADFVYVTSDPSILDVGFTPTFNETTNTTTYEMVEGENFNDTLNRFQIQNFAASNLNEGLNKVTIPLTGISNEFPGIQETVVTCNNATENIPVVSFVFDNETEEGISLFDNCIIINAETSVNYLVYADMLKYSIMVQ